MNFSPLPNLQTVQERILVIFPGALGDFICFLPALQELAAGRKADLLARSEYAGLVPENVVARSLECYEISRLFSPGAEGDERLGYFFGSYGNIYSWMASSRPEFVKHLGLLSQESPLIFPFRPSGARMHMIDYYLSCVGKSSDGQIFPSVALRPDAISWRDKFWQEKSLTGKRVLVLAPGSGAKEKNWPIDYYRRVAEWWEKSIGGKSIIVLGPVEEEKLKTGYIWGSALVVKELKLAQLAALLAQSDLYLGNDSGVTHLAASLGVRTVALFGPTDLVQWAPRGKKVVVIAQNMACSPCTESVMKCCLHRACLTALSTSAMISVLQRALERPPCGRRGSAATLTRGG